MRVKLKQLIVAVLAAIALPVLVAAPTYARQGQDDDTANSATTSSVSSLQTVETKKANETDLNHRLAEFEKSGQDTVKELESKKDNTKKHTEQERQKSCEARSASLTKKLNKKVASAEKHKAVFDKIFTRIKNFHDTKNLTTANYDALVATAVQKQAATDTAIATLKGFDTTIDCTQVDAAATKVAAFKAALTATKESLSAYRTSIKDLIVVVKASAPADTTGVN